jgi:hypothetical protein
MAEMVSSRLLYVQMFPDTLVAMRSLVAITEDLATYGAELEAGQLTATDAERVVVMAAKIKNLASAIEMVAARRVAQSQSWKHRGFRTPAEWLAAQSKSSVGDAIGLLETAERLDTCPHIEQQVRAGGLSDEQARALTRAVAADPAAESTLLAVAERDGLGKLKQECRAVEHAAGDETARHERIRRRRSVRHWTDDDGAFRLTAALTPEAGATVLGALAPFEQAVFDQARLEGRRESPEAYAADALVAMADASLAPCSDDEADPHGGGAGGEGGVEPGRRPRSRRGRTRKPSFTVLVDSRALKRGYAEPGETCEIPGVGPVPVSVLIDLAPDAVWHALVTDGVDVQAYASLSRYIPTFLRVALEARDRECVRPGCNVAHGLEIDHTHDHALGGPTSLSNLARLCPHDHRLKTYGGWNLTGPPDNRLFQPPDGPADPHPP